MFGINGAEALVLLVVAVLVVGPERLPAYAEQLARWARDARTYVSSAKERVQAELGEEAADLDWASLDPRRYDPRRIVREALLEDVPGPVPGRDPSGTGPAGAREGRPAGTAVGGGAVGGGAVAAVVPGPGSGASSAAAPGSAASETAPPPFDDEAT